MESLIAKLKRYTRRLPTLCLVCGVDSGPIRSFLFIVIGGLVGASLFLLAWSVITKRLRVEDNFGRMPIEKEKETECRNPVKKII